MLHIWMPEANGFWLWSTGENWLQAANLEQLIQDIQPHRNEEAVVFFSSHHTQIVQQDMDKAQFKQLGAQGIKYLIEEYVTLPIEQMNVVYHYAIPHQLTVLAVAQHLIETWQSVLSLLPIQVIALLPDFLILPAPAAGEINIVHLHGRTLIRENLYKGVAVDQLDVYLQFQPTPLFYHYSNLQSNELEQLFQVTTAENRQIFDYQFERVLKPRQHPFNVLPQAQTQRTLSGYWKACIAIAIVILLTQFTYDAFRWFKFKSVADTTSAQAIDLYKYWFGANSRVTEQNLQSMFSSQLRLSQSNDTNVLDLLSRIGPIVQQQHMLVQQVNYESATLSLTLEASSNNQLQDLTQQLNQQGFKASLGNLKATGTQAIGVIKIQQ